MSVKKMLLLTCLIVLGTMAGTERSVDARQLCLMSDGSADVVAPLHRAFEQGVRHVHFARGTYCLGDTLRLPSGTHLSADPTAEFRAADGIAVRWLVTNDDHENGNADICIEGGVWNGNCDNRPGKTFKRTEKHAGIFFHFQRVKGLTVRDLRAYNAVSYHFSLSRVTDFTLHGLRIGGKSRPFCQDGIHMGGGCERGHIDGVEAFEGGMGDDLIALNADDVLFYPWNQDHVNAPIRDITVENVVASNCYTVIRLLSVHQPIERIVFRNFKGGYRTQGINMDAARHCAHPLFKNEQYPNGIGALKDVLFENFELWRHGGHSECVTYETNGQNVRFKNLRYRSDLDTVKGPCSTIRFRFLGRTVFRERGDEGVLEPGGSLSLKRAYIEDLAVNTIW